MDVFKCQTEAKKGGRVLDGQLGAICRHSFLPPHGHGVCDPMPLLQAVASFRW